MKSHVIVVICPYCGHYEEVDADSDEFVCEHCGRSFVVFN